MCSPPKASRAWLDHLEAIVELGDRAVIGRGLAARRLDLVDDLLRRRPVGALAAAAGAGIVDDDLGAVRGHQLGDFGADPATRAGADRDPSLEHAHPSTPFAILVPSRGFVGAHGGFVNPAARLGPHRQAFTVGSQEGVR